jgi:hypothetical protein
MPTHSYNTKHLQKSNLAAPLTNTSLSFVDEELGPVFVEQTINVWIIMESNCMIRKLQSLCSSNELASRRTGVFIVFDQHWASLSRDRNLAIPRTMVYRIEFVQGNSDRRGPSLSIRRIRFDKKVDFGYYNIIFEWRRLSAC